MSCVPLMGGVLRELAEGNVASCILIVFFALLFCESFVFFVLSFFGSFACAASAKTV